MDASQDKSIFYADGDPQSTEAIEIALCQTGVPVTRFERVDDCVESVGRQGCRLLVSNALDPAEQGLELLAKVKKVAPWLPVIVLVDRGQIRTAVRAMKAGATHCLERPARARELRLALEAVLAQTGSDPQPPPLSQIETDVLQLLFQGHTSNEIGEILGRSARTVEVHRRHLRDKLGAHGLVDLIRKAATLGLLQDQPFAAPASANA